ncbi:MAG: BspA family leucine-rich repeat surface protein [Lachnospiraceae bacterium]|nr:BspA family leucine-rich repeat surface protein [Lachnospiraceae bacterium]
MKIVKRNMALLLVLSLICSSYEGSSVLAADNISDIVGSVEEAEFVDGELANPESEDAVNQGNEDTANRENEDTADSESENDSDSEKEDNSNLGSQEDKKVTDNDSSEGNENEAGMENDFGSDSDEKTDASEVDADVSEDVQESEEIAAEKTDSMDVDSLLAMGAEDRLAAMSSADDIDGGFYEDVAWVIDVNGKLTVIGTGEFISAPSYWSRSKASIISAEIYLTGTKYASYMFHDCIYMESVDLSNFDTSQVTNMRCMFYGCESLTSLDVSNFDTSQVTDMSLMFYYCLNLKSLDTSSFNTAKVETMEDMFGWCQVLESVDTSGFNTSQVTNMRGMFGNCPKLTYVDASGFDTSLVTNMNYMFAHCRSLKDLDVSSFNTSRVTDMSSMFSNCSSLTGLDLSGFDTRKVTNMDEMFFNCKCTSLDLSGFDTSKITSMWNMFYGCSRLTSLDLSSFDTSQVTNMESMFWDCDGLESLDVSNFDTGKVTNMHYMFAHCSSLQSLDLSSFDTSQVKDMEGMFTECKSLTSIDLSSFDTGQVVDMKFMFLKCSGLESIDLSALDTSQVTSMYRMFVDCRNLKSVNLSGLNTAQVTDMQAMFLGCTNLKSIDMSNCDVGSVTTFNKIFDDCDSLTTIKTPCNLKISVPLPVNKREVWITSDKKQITELPQNSSDSIEITKKHGGFYEEILWLIDDDGKLTVEGTGEISASSSETNRARAPWYDDREYIISAEINVTGMKNAYAMFYGCGNMVSVDLSNFDMADVTNATYMFESCSSLTTVKTPLNLGLSVELPIQINTVWYDPDGENVTELPKSLSYSIELTKNKIDVGEGTYGNIEWLIDKDLKLTVKGTGEISDTKGYYRAPWYSYRNYIESAKIEVTGMTDASYMFYACSSLTSVDLSDFDASQITDMSGMFYGCKSLTSLDLSSLDTTQLANMSDMFNWCVSLKSVNLGDFNTSRVTDMSGMFSRCDISLISDFLSSVDTGNVTNMSGIFSYCQSITSMDFLSSIDTGNVTDMSDMFNSTGLLSMNFSAINTKNVTNMSGMFSYTRVNSVDFSGADTSNVTNMSYMLSRTGFNSINLSGLDTSNVTDMSHMFDDCYSVKSIDLSGLDTSNVTDMSYMFYKCSRLTSVDFGGANIQNVTDMSNMFYDCSNLTNVDFGSSSANVSNIDFMFRNCRSLISVDLSRFDTGNLLSDNARNIFYNADSLVRINTPLNLSISTISLPTIKGGHWVRSDNGEAVKSLPTNLSYSVLLVRESENDEEKPPVLTNPYIAVIKTKTRYVVGDKLNIDDMTVIYYDSKGVASEVTDYSTNAAEIDMSSAGIKELVVTYKELTILVNIYVTSGNKEGIKIELEDTGKTYIYTGTAVTPKVKVTNNGEPLTEGIDYTVKYSNNIKASAAAKITVTGKGNLTQSYIKLFTIEKKQLNNTDINNDDMTLDDETSPKVEGDYVTVVEGSKISPVLLYGGTKLTAKDFKVPDEYKSYKWKLEDKNDESKKTITVTGQGNFQGTRTLTVKIISKAEQKNYKLNVSLGKEAKNLTYDAQPKDIKALGLLTISTNNTPAAELIEAKEGENGDYIISYPNDITSAGTKKFTVTGISDRCIGTVTKSFTIKPKKTEFSVEYDKDNKGYDFVSTGTTIPDDELIVRDPQFIDGAPLIKGKDYKVSYSGNKKVGTGKIIITGLGSYKGSKCTKTFTINKAVLNNNPSSTTAKTKGLEIAVADKVFNKAGVYKSAPYVSIDGVLLKASNYTVTYYLDNPVVNAGPRVMDSKNKVTGGETTVWVKIVGKGNYAADDETCYATASYRVRSKASTDSYDLSKAKISFQDKDGNPIKKAEFNGKPITNEDIKVVVTYKSGSETVTLDATWDYTVTFVNNVNKGKATVVITGRPGQNRYVGSKTASFSIVANNLKNLLL